MAKVKNKKNSVLADKVRNKRRTEAAKKILNPFEVHVNREKFKVLGRKMKHDRGLPGVSRAKAIQKRKETLGVEMKLLHKSNSFVDRRLGEADAALSGEQRVLARFAAEQARRHAGNNIYNLADDVLTHKGQTLEEIEKFDDPRSSDEEDDDGRKFGGLDNRFVAEGHFGGGILSKTENKDGAKSHKDLIEQLIAESKKRKAEKQKLKEQTLDLTEKLDTEWKDLQPVVFKKPRLEPQEESLIDKLLSKEDRKGEDYDKMMRELRFEKRGTPSDALQSEEKLAKQERERLERLEREREQRMRGAVHANVNTASGKHRSADDLDDNFELDAGPNYMVSYDKDGKLLMPEDIANDHSLKKRKVEFGNEAKDSENDVSGSSEEESSDQDGEDDSQSDQTASLQVECASSVRDGEKVLDTNEEVDRNSEQSEKKSADDTTVNSDETAHGRDSAESGSGERHASDDGGDESETKLDNSTLDSDDCSDASDEPVALESRSKKTKKVLKKVNEEAVSKRNKERERERSAAGARSAATLVDLGENSFDLAAASSDHLNDTLSEKTPAHQALFLERLAKRYHTSLAEDNKALLRKLFAYLLQYTNDIFTDLTTEQDIINSFKIFDRIAPQIYDLAQQNVMNAKHCLSEVVIEKYSDFRKNSKIVPDLDTLIFFKLVSLVFPTSDFRHPVATPCLVFMSEILTKCKFNNAYSIARGLFITSLILEYTVLSKRFVPSAINFIRGVIFLSANISLMNPVQVVPPFKLHSKEAKMLVLEDDYSKSASESKVTSQNKMAAMDLVTEEVTSEFKIRCFSTSVAMLREMFTNCEDLETQECMFTPHIQLLGRVDLDLYPRVVAKRVSEAVSYMKESLEMKTYAPLAREKKRPRALRQYEPDVQEVFTGSKSSKLTREQAERDKLKHKLKRETKGALREIRRDKAFVAGVKIRQKIQSDNLRKSKVKEIYRDAAIQQGELNKLKRSK